MVRKGAPKLGKGFTFTSMDEEALWFALAAIMATDSGVFLEPDPVGPDVDFVEDELVAQSLLGDEFDDPDEEG